MTEQDIRERCAQSAHGFRQLEALAPKIQLAGERVADALRAGGKALFCGNGGSAADSQHLAAELMGRFLRERAPLAAMALTVDTSSLTAISNDYGYEAVFARQLLGIGRAGDVLLALSTSGASANVIAAARTAREMGIGVIAFTGEAGGALASLCDVLLNVPATRTDLIQELHIAVGHMICGLVEEALS